MRIPDCNWMQLEEYLRGDDRIVLPLGSIEQHGYLSLAVDQILAERVAVEAAEPLGVPVLPALPYGIAPYFAYPGSPTLSWRRTEPSSASCSMRCTRRAFRRFLLVNGHGGNEAGRPALDVWAAAPGGPGAMAQLVERAAHLGRWSRSVDPDASHASWLENFPWTRLPESTTPRSASRWWTSRVRALIRPACGAARRRLVRRPLRAPDEEVLRDLAAGVEEVREVLATAGAMPDLPAGSRSSRERGRHRSSDRDGAASVRGERSTASTGTPYDVPDAGRWRLSSIGSRPIDILVNCAGGVCGQVGKPLEEVLDDDWHAVVDANLTSTFVCTRAVVPGMKEPATGASSTSLRRGAQRQPHGIQAYASAKAAQIGFTRQTAHELGRFGITVNSIAPGFVPSNPSSIGQWESYGTERQAQLLSRSPSAGWARPRTSRTACSSSSPRNRAGSPARCSRSTAATPSSELTDGTRLHQTRRSLCDSGSLPFARSPSQRSPRCAFASRSQSSHWPPSRPSRSARSAPQPALTRPKRPSRSAGGHLRIARQEDSQSFDKTNVFQNESIWLVQQINESLYTVAHRREDSEALAGNELQGLEERKKYTFKLRKGVRFSNGQPMTAADVKFSIDDARARTRAGATSTSPSRTSRRPTPRRSCSTSSTRGHRSWPTSPCSRTGSSPRTSPARSGRSSTSTRSAPARSCGTSGSSGSR